MRFFICAVLMLGFSANSFAKGGHDGACKADREKFCANVEKGEGRMMECMKAHASELSPECQAKHAEMKTQMKNAHEACQADVAKFCAEEKPGKGAIRKCLRSHQAELSEGCATTMGAKGHHGKHK